VYSDEKTSFTREYMRVPLCQMESTSCQRHPFLYVSWILCAFLASELKRRFSSFLLLFLCPVAYFFPVCSYPVFYFSQLFQSNLFAFPIRLSLFSTSPTVPIQFFLFSSTLPILFYIFPNRSYLVFFPNCSYPASYFSQLFLSYFLFYPTVPVLLSILPNCSYPDFFFP
jgi:hypothetical protein